MDQLGTMHNANRQGNIKTALKFSKCSLTSSHRKMAFLEEKIDTRLPYRIGYPTLPVFPVITEHVTHEPVDYGRVLEILANYRISYHYIYLARRVNRKADLAGCEPRVVVVSTYEDGCRSNWIHAVRDLHSSCNRPIELVDKQAESGLLALRPVLSTDCTLIDSWKKLLPEFFARIQAQSWITVDVMYRDFPSRGMRPSIIISAQDADQGVWWDQILPDLTQELQTHKLDVELVLLYLGSLRLLGPDDDRGILPILGVCADDIYEHTVQMGASCGIPHSDCSGTLGGRIRLEKDSSILDLGLTNFHVLKRGLDTVDRPITRPFPPDGNELYGTVHSPSDKDHDNRVSRLRSNIAEIDEKLPELRQHIQWLSKDDPAWTSKSAKVQSLESLRQTCTLVLQQAETFPRYLGSIYAASGFQTCKNPTFPAYEDWELDWGLIRVDEGKSISNSPEATPPKFDGKHGLVKHYCSLNSGEEYEVIKRGRTTDWTTGTVNAIPTTLQLKEHEGKRSLAYPIVGKDRKFLEPGDSGSFVLLSEQKCPNQFRGALVGLAFADSQSTNNCYMMPIDLVINHIEQVTKGKVIEPQYGGTV